MKDFLQNKIIISDMDDIRCRDDNWEWLKGKTIFITGAYGMLASYIVYFLIYMNEKYDYGIHIVLQGRHINKMQSRFGEYINREYLYVTNVDICSEISLDIKADYIIHAASLASSQYYGTMPVDVLKPNSLGTFYLLDYAKRCNCKSFLFFSSCDVYGEFAEYGIYSENDFGSMNPMLIRNCYGESKRMGENMCASWYHQYGVPAKSVRIAHTYGPTMDIDNDVRVFAEFVRNVLNKQDIVMKSDGSAIRDFCYISDAVDGFFKILRYGSNGEAYTLLNDKMRLSIKELAEIVSTCIDNNQLNIIYERRNENEAYIESFVKYPPRYSTKKISELDWFANIDAKEGFRRTILSFMQEYKSLKLPT